MCIARGTAASQPSGRQLQWSPVMSNLEFYIIKQANVCLGLAHVVDWLRRRGKQQLGAVIVFSIECTISRWGVRLPLLARSLLNISPYLPRPNLKCLPKGEPCLCDAQEALSTSIFEACRKSFCLWISIKLIINCPYPWNDSLLNWIAQIKGNSIFSWEWLL